MPNLDPNIAKWYADPEFRELPREQREQAISGYFDQTTAGDSDFLALKPDQQADVKTGFVGFHVDPFTTADKELRSAELPDDPSRKPASGLFQRLVAGAVPLPVRMAIGLPKSGTEQVLENTELGRQALRYYGDYVSGGLGTAEGILGAAQAVTDNETVKKAGDWVQKRQEALAPPERNFFDSLASGLGSMTAFAVPGAGASAGLGRLAASGAVRSGLAGWGGASAMAGFEAATEAGSKYREMIQAGDDPGKAKNAAFSTFMWNLPLLVVTDKLGYFGKSGNWLKRRLVSGLMEGTQEAGQQAISDLSSGDKIKTKDALEQAAIGGIIGAIFGGFGDAKAEKSGKAAEERLNALRVATESGLMTKEELVSSADHPEAKSLGISGIIREMAAKMPKNPAEPFMQHIEEQVRQPREKELHSPGPEPGVPLSDGRTYLRPGEKPTGFTLAAGGMPSAPMAPGVLGPVPNPRLALPPGTQDFTLLGQPGGRTFDLWKASLGDNPLGDEGLADRIINEVTQARVQGKDIPTGGPRLAPSRQTEPGTQSIYTRLANLEQTARSMPADARIQANLETVRRLAAEEDAKSNRQRQMTLDQGTGGIEGPRTLRGQIKKLGGINVLNFKEEAKNFPTAAKFLLNKKGGQPLDKLEENLREEGWLAGDENLLEVLRDPEVLKRGNLRVDPLQKKRSERTPQEQRVVDELYGDRSEPEAPPEVFWNEKPAVELTPGEEVIARDPENPKGYDTFKVKTDGQGNTILEDGRTIKLDWLDPVNVWEGKPDEVRLPAEKVEPPPIGEGEPVAPSRPTTVSTYYENQLPKGYEQPKSLRPAPVGLQAAPPAGVAAQPPVQISANVTPVIEPRQAQVAPGNVAPAVPDQAQEVAPVGRAPVTVKLPTEVPGVSWAEKNEEVRRLKLKGRRTPAEQEKLADLLGEIEDERDARVGNVEAQFPVISGMVDDRVARKDVPNTSSIESSLDNYSILPGIREVSLDLFDRTLNNTSRVKALSEEIKKSGEINPMIVVVGHQDGPYILEGQHRFDALNLLGAKSFPAKVVVDNESLIEAPVAPPAATKAETPTATPQGQETPQSAAQVIEEPKFSRAPAPLWYSQMGKVLGEKLPGKASPEEMIRLIDTWAGREVNGKRGKAEFKGEELDESGLKEALADPEVSKTLMENGKVSKKKILDFLGKGGVKVTEVVRGGPDSDLAEAQREFDSAEAEVKQIVKDIGFAEYYQNVVAEDLASGKDVDEVIEDWLGESASVHKNRLMWLQKRLEQNRDYIEQAKTYGNSSKNDPKFSNPGYNTPGGEDYRELILTVPGRGGRFELRKETYPLDEEDPSEGTADSYTFWDKYYERELKQDGNIVSFDNQEQANAYLSKINSDSNTGDFGGYAEKFGGFQSPHFPDEEGYVAHIRFDTRTDAEGKKTMFLQEVQGDKGQAARKEGIKKPFTKQAELDRAQAVLSEAQDRINQKVAGISEIPDDYNIIKNPAGGLVLETPEGTRIQLYATSEDGVAEQALSYVRRNIKVKEYAKIQDFADRAENLRKEKEDAEKGVPPGPYISKTSSWTMLAMRRAIRWAAENGYDRVAWTPGSEQFKRWGSEEITWKRNADGSWTVGATEQRGGHGPEGMDVEAEARRRGVLLEDTGKTITTKEELHAIAKRVLKRDSSEEQIKKIVDRVWTRMQTEDEGSSLPRKEGMEGYYNNILPKEVNAYIKKWGAKVGTTEIQTEKGIGEEITPELLAKAAAAANRAGDIEAAKFLGQQVKRLEEHGDYSGGLFNPSMTASQYLQNVRRFSDRTLTVHSFDITPAMKEEALGKGMPLFKKGQSGAPPSLSRDHLQAVADTVSGKWANTPAGGIKVVNDTSEFPENARDMAQRYEAEGDVIQGVYDPAGKAIYINASAMTSMGDVLKVLAHEGDHFGLLGFLGPEIKPFLNQLYMAKKKEIDAYGKSLGFDMGTRQGKLIGADEWFVNENGKGTLQAGWWKRFVDWFKRILRGWGVKSAAINKLTDSEIADVARNVRSWVEEGAAGKRPEILKESGPKVTNRPKSASNVTSDTKVGTEPAFSRKPAEPPPLPGERREPPPLPIHERVQAAIAKPDPMELNPVASFLADTFKGFKDRDKGWQLEKPDTNQRNRILNTLEFFAEKVPALQRTFEAALNRRDNYNSVSNELFEYDGRKSLLTPLKDLKAKDGAEYKKVVTILLESDRNRKTHTDQSLRQAGLKASGIEAWKSFRKMMDNGFEALMGDMRKMIQDYEESGEPLPKVAIRDKGGIVQVDLKQALAMMGNMKAWYFPRIRHQGQYRLYAFKDGANPIMEMFDTKDLPGTGINKRAAELERQGYHVVKETSKRMPEDVFQLAGSNLATQAILNQALEKMQAKGQGKSLSDMGFEGRWETSADGQKEFAVTGPWSKRHAEAMKAMGGKWYGTPKAWRFTGAKADIETRLVRIMNGMAVNKMADEVFAMSLVEQTADIFKGRGFRSSMIHRQPGKASDVFLGYEEDALTAGAKYIRGISAGLAKKQMASDMIRAANGTDISWKEFKAGNEDATYEDYLNFVDDRRIDPARQPNAFREATTLMQDMLRNEESLDRIMGTMKGVAVMKYLAGRVAAPVVNLTALVTSVPASMNGYGGIPIHRSFDLLGKAMADYGKYRFGKREEMSANDRALFAEIENNGWHKAQFNQEALSVLQSKAGQAWSRAIELGMIGFSATETINRVSTIAGAYKGIRQFKPELSHDEALKLAKKVSDRAHGVYGKETLPAWARGKEVGAQVARAAYVFRKFSHTYLQAMYDLGVKQKNAKAMLYMVVSPAIIGGLGASTAVWILNALKLMLGWDEPEEKIYDFFSEMASPTAGRFARYGLAGLAGFNIKGSLSIGAMDIPTDLKGLLGAPGGVMKDIGFGVSQIARGNLQKGLERIAPAALGNISRAVREGALPVVGGQNQGVTKTTSNAPVFFGTEQIKPTVFDSVLRAFSFNPANISEKQEILWSESKISEKYKEKKFDIYSRFRAFFSNPQEQQTQEEWDKLMGMVTKYNEVVRKPPLDRIASPITKRGLKAAMTMKPSKAEKKRAAEMAGQTSTEEEE